MKSSLIYYIYLLDSHISILYATLPHIPVLEMQACLPTDESAFQEASPEACRARFSCTQLVPRVSLVDLLQRLMGTDPISSQLSELTTFALFLTIGCRSVEELKFHN
jgi:hypothetical protein